MFLHVFAVHSHTGTESLSRHKHSHATGTWGEELRAPRDPPAVLLPQVTGPEGAVAPTVGGGCGSMRSAGAVLGGTARREGGSTTQWGSQKGLALTTAPLPNPGARSKGGKEEGPGRQEKAEWQ